MKNRLLKLTIMVTKQTFYGLMVVIVSLGTLMANSGKAQDRKITSVKESIISIHMQDAGLLEIMESIEVKTGYKFTYDKKEIDKQIRMEINFEKSPVEDVLLELSKNANLRFKQVNNNIHVKKIQNDNLNQEKFIEVIIQTRTVTGKVKSIEDAEGLPGVNVVEKGTTNGTVTNVQGEYSLEVSEGATLVFSSVGFTTEEVEIGGRSVIDLTMVQDIQQLQELVVIGYGTQEKSDITGSVASIDQEMLQKSPRVSVEQMLQGAAAGLNVTVNQSNAEGSANSMLIRGENSITASNNPFIVIDGIPYAGNLSELNPEDIASIEILKDASSAAIYGARGANGVILITTKRGKSGELRVNYEGTYAIDQIVNVPTMMDGATFYETKTGRGIPTTAIEDDGYDTGRSTDWLDLATQVGARFNNNISFLGGSENTKYYVSLSSINAKGVAIGDQFDRYTLRLNLDQKLLPWVTFSTSTQYGYYDRSGNDADFGDAFRMNPLGVPFNEDGSYKMVTWEDAVYSENPMLATLARNSDITRRFISNNSFNIDFPFLEGLSYNLNTGYDYRSRLQQSYFGRNTLTGLRDNGRSDTENGYDEDWIIENIISYKKDFGKHSLFLTGLYSAQSQWSEDHLVEAQGFPNDVMYFYQSNKASLIEPSASYTKANYISQMFRANYTFDERYLATFTVRRDGFSAFGDDNKFGIFPSMALGWNIGNEQFMNNIEQIDALKLRVSYGANGNQAVSPYSTLPRLSSEDYVDAEDRTLFGFFPNRLGDPSLGWETTTSFNTGIDFALFNSRISGSIDAYWSNTTDLLLSKSISDVNGTSSIIQNIGETANNGFELQINSINISTSDFTWETNFNISHFNTEIVNVGLTDAEGNFIDDIDSRWFIGQPVNVNFDFVFDGIYQEDEDDTPQGDVDAGEIRYLDANEDGQVSADDRRVIGRRIPDFITAMNNTFTYKNWSLSIFINAVSGITKRNELLTTNDNEMRLNRYDVQFWTPENNSNEYPRNAEGAKVNKFDMDFYRSADFLRLQDITLSYSLPGTLVDKIKLRNARLFVNARNLATWTSWIGLDPEFSDQTAVPQTSSFLFGVNIGL